MEEHTSVCHKISLEMAPAALFTLQFLVSIKQIYYIHKIYTSYSMVLDVIRADILPVVRGKLRAISKMSAGIICKTIE